METDNKTKTQTEDGMEGLNLAKLKREEKKYDNIHNEGGEGYNPYRAEVERREVEVMRAEGGRPKTQKEQIAALHERIRKECGSVAREWGGEEVDKKQAELYAQIRHIETEMEDEFAAEWTLDETEKRRENWNGFVRSLINSRGLVSIENQQKIYAKAKAQGWGQDEVKKAVKLHNLGPAPKK